MGAGLTATAAAGAVRDGDGCGARMVDTTVRPSRKRTRLIIEPIDQIQTARCKLRALATHLAPPLAPVGVRGHPPQAAGLSEIQSRTHRRRLGSFRQAITRLPDGFPHSPLEN